MPLHLCISCGAQATNMCQRCFDHYCSPECQAADWAEHKKTCIPMPALVPVPKNFPTKIQQINLLNSTTPTNGNKYEKFTVDLKDAIRTVTPVTNPRPLKQSTILDIQAANQPNRQLTMKSPPPLLEVKNTPAVPKKTTEIGEPVPEMQLALDAAAPPPASTPETNARPASFLNWRCLNVVAKQAVDPIGSPAVPVITPKADAAIKPPQMPLRAPPASTTVVIPPCASQAPTMPAALSPPAALAPWQLLVAIDTAVPQSLIVQHIDEDNPNILWTSPESSQPVCMQMLSEMNEALDAQHSPGIQAVAPTVGRLFAVPFEGLYYRAVVLKEVGAINEVYCQLIDYGNKLFVPLELVKQPLPIMLAQPQFGLRVRLLGRQRQPSIEETLHLRLLNMSNGVYEAEMVTNQLPTHPQPPVRSAPIVSTGAPVPVPVPVVAAVAVQQPPPVPVPVVAAVAVLQPPPVPVPVVAAVAVQQPPPPSIAVEVPAELPAKTFTANDMTILPLPTGQPVQLSCLDTSDLRHGIITAAAFDEERLRRMTQVLTQQIAEHCNGPLARPFVPRIGEMCLAVFEDGWYRAMRVEDMDSDRLDAVRLTFIDYGNTTEVAKNEIVAITAEIAAEPCLANLCLINGVPDRIPLDLIKAFLDANPLFMAKSVNEMDNQYYLIEMDI